jgi:hypothetical protein
MSGNGLAPSLAPGHPAMSGAPATNGHGHAPDPAAPYGRDFLGRPLPSPASDYEIIKGQLKQLEQPRRFPPPLPRPLIFLHLPKAGGSTMQDILVRQYRTGFGFRFTGDRAELRAFRALPERVRARFDLLHGHVHFGIHQWVPDPAVYVTMLRDPVDRVISHYYFVLSHPGHYVYKKASRLSLKEYAATKPTHEIDNDMVRWLTAREHFEVRLGKVTRSMLDEAKWNLEFAVSVFGLMERFDESLLCFQRALWWSDVSYREMKNVNKNRPPLAEIPPDALDAIREANALDVELYEHAKALFEEQLMRLQILSRPAGSQEPVGAGSRPQPVG